MIDFYCGNVELGLVWVIREPGQLGRKTKQEMVGMLDDSRDISLCGITTYYDLYSSKMRLEQCNYDLMFFTDGDSS